MKMPTDRAVRISLNVLSKNFLAIYRSDIIALSECFYRAFFYEHFVIALSFTSALRYFKTTTLYDFECQQRWRRELIQGG